MVRAFKIGANLPKEAVGTTSSMPSDQGTKYMGKKWHFTPTVMNFYMMALCVNLKIKFKKH